MEVTTNNKRIVKNTIILYVRMFFALIVSLYTSRVVLQTLGVIDYGVYNTVAGFVTLFTFLNSTLSVSMQRFYNFEGARFGEYGYRRVYSAGIVIHICVMVIMLIILETLGLWYINNVMVVPADSLSSANVIFQTSAISLCLLVLTIPYSGAVMAMERMGFYAIVSVLDVILRLICVLILPFLPYDKLSSYGILLLSVSIINFLLYYIFAKKKILAFKFDFNVDRSLLKQMLSFSSWNVIGTFAFTLKGQALNMLLNFFFGPAINAARGIAFQIGNAITSFTTNLTLAFKPQMVASYSRGDENRVKSLFYIQSKICFVLVAILMTPVILNIDPILEIWLGDEIPDYTATFSVLVLFDALICSLNAPCTQLVFATGKIRNYQIVSSLVNLLLLPMSWLFLYLGFAATSVFVITIVFSIINQFMCVWQMSKVFDLGIMSYLLKVIRPCCIFIIICSIPGVICNRFMEQSIFRLLTVVVISMVWGSILTYFFMLGIDERAKLLKLIRKN